MYYPGKRSSCLLLTLLLLLSFFPSSGLAGNGYADLQMARTLQEMEKDNNNRWIDVPGRGSMLYYAQTNPFWSGMRYEVAGSSTHRRFGDGGCCPTSAAIAFANLLPMTQLGQIRSHKAPRAEGYGISVSGLNPLNLLKHKGIWWLEYAEDYQRYLPLVFAQYAAGNNANSRTWRLKSKGGGESAGGTSAAFIPELCAIYGLNYLKLPGRMNMDWLEPVKNGGIAVALANSQWHPFSKGSGHYVAIVGCDDEYVYIMDPQDKGKYDSDRNKLLEVIEPGFVRAKLSNFRELMFGMIYVITNPEVDARLALSQP